MPCGSHTLNLVVSDAAKSSVQSTSFFGILQRVYVIFSSSTGRWSILKEHVSKLTVKPLLDTRWESRIDSVKVLRYQLQEVHAALEALVDHSLEKRDGMTATEAKSLAKEIVSAPFIVSIIVWHNVLYHINNVSKMIQSPSISMETLRNETHAVEEFLEGFRESGFIGARTDAKEIAKAIADKAGEEIPFEFPEQRRGKKRAMFDYESVDDGPQMTAEERYTRDVFLSLIDTALFSLRERFSQLDSFTDLFGFLFSTKDMQTSY